MRYGWLLSLSHQAINDFGDSRVDFFGQRVGLTTGRFFGGHFDGIADFQDSFERKFTICLSDQKFLKSLDRFDDSTVRYHVGGEVSCLLYTSPSPRDS